MRKTASLAVTETSSLALAVRELMPKAKTSFLKKCTEVGLDEGNIAHAIALCEIHQCKLPSIVRWLGDGLSLKRIEECLAIHEQMPNLTIRLANEYLERISFQAVTAPGMILETLEEFFPELGGRFPAHRLLHVIDEIFGGDILGAYHLAKDDPERFLEVIRGRMEWTTREEEDESWAVDS